MFNKRINTIMYSCLINFITELNIILIFSIINNKHKNIHKILLLDLLEKLGIIKVSHTYNIIYIRGN